MKKVFLGGTCNGSAWREDLIKLLTIDFFNPVVPNWTPECQEEELKQREECDFCLYVLTPKMTGFYSVAEVVDDSNKRPNKTVFCLLDKDVDSTDGTPLTWTAHQNKSFTATEKMLMANGAMVCGSLQEVADYLNKAQLGINLVKYTKIKEKLLWKRDFRQLDPRNYSIIGK